MAFHEESHYCIFNLASSSLEMLALKVITMHRCNWRRGIESMRLGQVTRTTTWKCTAATRWRQPFKLQVVPQWNKGTGRCQGIRTARLWTLNSTGVDGVRLWTRKSSSKQTLRLPTWDTRNMVSGKSFLFRLLNTV